MCGIGGFIGSHERDESLNILKRMMSRIRHRGPDENGAYISEEICLGSVRLSIVDIASGTMPIANDRGDLWIVFNGEVYNHPELREELTYLGYSFSTNSDTEVVLKLYEHFGPEALKKLNGQFAIAIWDSTEHQLFLARDRIGIRPLYYSKTERGLVFASEMKAFLEYPDFSFEFSEESLADFFTFWTASGSNTLFKNVYELEPGSYMIYKNHKIELNSYWDLPLVKNNEYPYSDLDDSIEAFDALFKDSIRLRLRADVPVAAYLSGGIDSAVTTSYITSEENQSIETFSISFDDVDFDESKYQKDAVEYFRTDHSRITCTSEEISNSFAESVWFCEAPLLRTAPIPMRLLSGLVRKNGIKVVITGEGSDELLGGYNIFKETKIRMFWSKDPESKFRPLLLKKLYPYLPHISKSGANSLKMFFGLNLLDTENPFYSHLLRWNNTSKIKTYFSDKFKNQIKDYDPIEKLEQSYGAELEDCDYMSRAQFIELKLFMSRYLLSSQGDRMAMASSVEGRYPFLDHRIIEFCMNLSPDLKMKGLNEKYLLKKMSKGKIPDTILNRSKQAYRAPIKSALLSNNIDPYLSTMLSKDKIELFGIFDSHRVETLVHRLKTRSVVSELDNMALSGILSLQTLYDQFINRNFPIDLDEIMDFDKLVIENNKHHE